MSKMDNLRAMREARYARGQAAAAGKAEGGASKRAVRPAAKVAPEPAASAAPAEPAAADAVEELCGHRNMSGRTCTRERGHAAKSHRYS